MVSKMQEPTITVELTGAEAAAIGAALCGMRAELASDLKCYQECVNDFKTFEARGAVTPLLHKLMARTDEKIRAHGEE